MLFLCGLTCRIILYNRPCTSQRGIALPLWKPLLNQQQYPARITWRFLIRAGAAAPLSNFALTRKVVLKRRMASLISVRPRSLLPRVCRNASGKLLSHPFAALTALVAVGYRHFCNKQSFFYACTVTWRCLHFFAGTDISDVINSNTLRAFHRLPGICPRGKAVCSR